MTDVTKNTVLKNNIVRIVIDKGVGGGDKGRQVSQNFPTAAALKLSRNPF